ncbi:hypothetical protein [Desulfovibrio cuneatus]|uniref:hypothetical protein n=1 Tax=Desulfovibrio cuneatus TaxID=159728 RepID=UPI000483C8DB|nr:hypothetical protein [Desulfovibrio cuneatus]
MKKFLMTFCCLGALAFAGAACAEEPAILADLGQSQAVAMADDATLDAAQGANITEYSVIFSYGANFRTDARSKTFSNWRLSSGPRSLYTNYFGTWYVSDSRVHGYPMVIWNQSNSPVSAWATRR